MNLESSLQAKNCPLCGSPNKCENLADNDNDNDNSNQPCWCMDANISFPNELLNNVAKVDKNMRCICQSCALSANKEA